MTVLKSLSTAITRRSSLRRNVVRWLLLITGVVCVLLIGYVAMASLIALVMASAEGARFSLAAVLVAALPGWLAAHQVPLSVAGAPLTVFPLVPTALMMLLIGTASSHVARKSRIHRSSQARTLIVVMAVSHAVFGASITMVLGDTVNAVPVDAFVWCGLTAAVASTAGVVNRCGLTYAIWERVDTDMWSGLRVGLLALAALVGAGALVVFAGVCLSAPEMFDLLRRTGSVGDALGSTLLSLLYVPNAVIAGWAFATGAGLSIGRFVFQPLHATPVSVPDLPLLAVLPSSGPSWWWVAVFLLPATVGVLVGWSSLYVHSNRMRRLRAVAVAAMIASVGILLLAGMVGGRLGGGAFDPVTLRPGLLAVATFCWIALPAAVVASFGTPRSEVESDIESDAESDAESDQEESGEEVVDVAEVAVSVPPDGGADNTDGAAGEDGKRTVDDADDLLPMTPEDAAEMLVAEIEKIDPAEFDVDSHTGDERPR